MGTQWSGMGKDLMKIDIFAKSIQKSAEILKPYAIDLVGLVTNGLQTSSSNIRSMVPAFVSIAAVQVIIKDL